MSEHDREVRFDIEELLRAQDPDGKLERYFELLDVENRRINIVSRETLPESAPEGVDRYHGLRRLAAESIFPLTMLHQSRPPRYLDIGSGGGFPAIPLLLTTPITDAVLVERTQKKAGALRRMLLKLGLNAEIMAEPFEEVKPARESFDLITLRLVKLDRALQEQILPLVAPGGDFVYYARAELAIEQADFSVKYLRFADRGTADFHTATIVTRKPQ